MSKIERFLALVQACDGEQIEYQRDQVTPADLEALAQAYWTLETWEQKAALVNLVQDHIDPQTHEIMQDILQAPNTELENQFEMTKAIALCHLEQDFDRFMVYYNDRQLLERTIQQYLEPPPAEPERVEVERISHRPEIKRLVSKGSKRLNLLFYAGVIMGILMGPIVLLTSIMPKVMEATPANDLSTMRIFGGVMTVLFGVVLVEQFGKLKRDRRLAEVLDQSPEELVWVYKEVSVGRVRRRARAEGTPVARFVHLYFHLLDKSHSKVWLAEPEADRLLEMVRLEFTHVSCGYSSELLRVFKESPARMAANPQQVEGAKLVSSSVRYS